MTHYPQDIAHLFTSTIFHLVFRYPLFFSFYILFKNKRTVSTKKGNQFLLSLIQKTKKKILSARKQKTLLKKEKMKRISTLKKFNAYFGVTCCIRKQLQQRYCFCVIFFWISKALINLRVKINFNITHLRYNNIVILVICWDLYYLRMFS